MKTNTTKVQLKLSIKGARDHKFEHHYCGTEHKGMNDFGQYFGNLKNFDEYRYGYTSDVWITQQGEREDHRIQNTYRAKLHDEIAKHLEQGYNKLVTECDEIQHKIQQEMISAQREAVTRITGQQPVLTEQAFKRDHDQLMRSLQRDTEEMDEWQDDLTVDSPSQYAEEYFNRYREKVIKWIHKINDLCDEANKPQLKIDQESHLNRSWRELSKAES